MIVDHKKNEEEGSDNTADNNTNSIITWIHCLMEPSERKLI